MKRAHIVLGTTILALGILLVVPAIQASEAAEVEPFQSSEDFNSGMVAQFPTGEPSASELNRQLTNPVSSIWSVSNQFNNFELNNRQWNNNWDFQPVMPVSLTKD